MSAIPGIKILEGIDVANDRVIEQLKNSNELPKKLDIVIANAGINIRQDPKMMNSTTSVLEELNINSAGI